jgi:Cu-Zn family superoxide dismutase
MAKGATIGPGSASLVRDGGTAVVIHAKADDLTSDPAGNSGDRIACGEVRN